MTTFKAAHKMTNSATYQDLLAEVSEFWSPLPDKPEETPHCLLSALWHSASGVRLSAELAKRMNTLPSLDSDTHKRLRTLLELRKSGVPLAHLTERQHFLGLELLAGPYALIPRKETEILGRAVLVKLKSLAVERGQLMVMDLCTGSGNLALAYANYEPAASVYGADISGDAITLAKRNAVHLGLQEHIDFIQGDMFAPFENGAIGKWDIISCNPPYISKAKVPLMHQEISRFEPEVAFNGGPLGISILAKLLRNAPRFLKPHSWLAFEVGLGQGDFFVKNLRNNPAFCEIEPQTDAAGNIRAILARSQPQ
jgi:release factor glutamine methyltransferase